MGEQEACVLADAAVALLQKPRQIDQAARQCVLERYDWESNLQRIGRLLESGEIEADI